MRIRFVRDEQRLMTIGSVDGRPEAVREFPDTNLRHLRWALSDWIQELKDYLGEEVESKSRA